ncbi:hypothetical protein GQ600_17344 [Phytophthora cactorum]|nr:hypothetical protein GQ600_17344 [Phytophthora cactorum]
MTRTCFTWHQTDTGISELLRAQHDFVQDYQQNFPWSNGRGDPENLADDNQEEDNNPGAKEEDDDAVEEQDEKKEAAESDAEDDGDNADEEQDEASKSDAEEGGDDAVAEKDVQDKDQDSDAETPKKWRGTIGSSGSQKRDDESVQDSLQDSVQDSPATARSRTPADSDQVIVAAPTTWHADLPVWQRYFAEYCEQTMQVISIQETMGRAERNRRMKKTKKGLDDSSLVPEGLDPYQRTYIYTHG